MTLSWGIGVPGLGNVNTAVGGIGGLVMCMLLGELLTLDNDIA